MGKHERKSIKEAEKIIVKILNSKNLNDLDKKNHWFNHAVVIVEKIMNDFKKIVSAEHLGDSYDTVGDIKLTTLGRKEIFIETKMSDTKSGIGTKANISQNALTENLLFHDNVKSWNEFREEKNHEKWVMKHLDEFSKYPARVKNIGNSPEQKENKARFLRDLAKKGNKKARGILNEIREKDRKEKFDYLDYLKTQKQNPKMIKRFLVLIMLGIHTKKPINNLIKRKNFFSEIKDLYIYYSNSYKGKVNVKRENAEERIRDLLGRYEDFRITFPKGLTHCKIVGIKDKKERPLLQIVLHWKNIAQGIKTPCLNIFDLTR